MLGIHLVNIFFKKCRSLYCLKRCRQYAASRGPLQLCGSIACMIRRAGAWEVVLLLNHMSSCESSLLFWAGMGQSQKGVSLT